MKKAKPPLTAPDAKFILVPIEKIDIGARQRSFDPKWAEAIASTLPELGLKQPIEVSASGDRFRLIAGLHRLEAVKVVGWESIPARLVRLDGANEDASAALHEAMENLLRNDLTMLDRMSHLSSAKEAHDDLHPEAVKAGRPKKMTRAAEDNLDILSTFSFSKTVAVHVGLDRRSVNRLTTAWNNLSPASRIRLRGSRLADHQSELLQLSELGAVGQKVVLDLLLSDPPSAAKVADAVAIMTKEPTSSPAERRIKRYHDTIKAMLDEERDSFFDGLSDEIQDYAMRKGWFE